MDKETKKKLQEEYKMRKPDMGIISFLCEPTGDRFLGISKDTKADINSTRFKLLTGSHPNKALLKLWQKYGEGGFVTETIMKHDYKDPTEDQSEELELLLEECKEKYPEAKLIWK